MALFAVRQSTIHTLATPGHESRAGSHRLPGRSAKPEKGEARCRASLGGAVLDRLGFKPREILFDKPEAHQARRDASVTPSFVETPNVSRTPIEVWLSKREILSVAISLGQ